MPSSIAAPHSHQRYFGRRPSRSLWTMLAACAAGASLGCALIIVLLWPRWPSADVAPDAPAIPVIVAGATFNVPPAAIRVPVQRRSGTHERLDLYFLWPSLNPPDRQSKLSVGERTRLWDRIFVTIVPAEGALTPGDRLRTIYPRYASEQAPEAPEGLRAMRFGDGTPYQGEDLFFDANEPERFIARCTRGQRGELGGTCFVDKQIGRATVTIRFARDWLSNWRDVLANAERLIAGLRPSVR